MYVLTGLGPHARRGLSVGDNRRGGSQVAINSSELHARCSYEMMPIQRVGTYIHTYSTIIHTYIFTHPFTSELRVLT